MASHMNLSERNQICFGLDTGKTIFQIADEIGRNRSMKRLYGNKADEAVDFESDEEDEEQEDKE